MSIPSDFCSAPLLRADSSEADSSKPFKLQKELNKIRDCQQAVLDLIADGKFIPVATYDKIDKAIREYRLARKDNLLP